MPSKRSLEDSKSGDASDEEHLPSSKKGKRVTMAAGTKSPDSKRKTPQLTRAWTSTNPISGEVDGRLYRKDAVYKSHLNRRNNKKKKSTRSKRGSSESTSSSTAASGAASKPALSRKKTAAEKLAERAQADMVDYSDLCQRFDNHHVLVCGGGEGVGAACAIRLAQEGASVTVWDRKKFRDTIKTCESVSTNDDATFDGSMIDVSDKAKVNEAMKDYLDSHAGFLDVVINAAGLTYRDCDRVLDTRLKASRNLVDACVPSMKNEKYGRIVLLTATQDNDTYTAMASAGLQGFVKAAAQQVANTGVTINTVAFRYVDTPTADDADRKAAKKSPIKRMADPGEIAGVVAAACSEEMSFTTGSVFDATGGIGF